MEQGQGSARRWPGLAAALLLLSACFGSPAAPPPLDTPEPEPRYVRTVPVAGEARLDPTGALPVSGRVLTSRGRPAGGISVVVERDEYGLFPRLCLIGCRLRPCDMGLETVTGADGRFYAGMCRRAGRHLELTLSSPERGLEVYLPIDLEGDRTLLPALRLWTPRVEYDPSGRVSWSRLPTRGFGALDRYEMRFRASASGDGIGDSMWFQFIAHPVEVLDPRVLEDTSGRVEVTAYTKMRLRPPCRPSCGRVFRPYFETDGVAYEGPGAPPSRGKPCFVGTPRRARVEPCHLTDGDFSFEIDPCPELVCGAEPRWVGIDAGAPRRMEVIVARGCGLCEVFVSSDGNSWTYVLPSGRGDGLTDEVSVHTPPRRMSIRYVRVSYPEDMLELSYW